MTDLTTHQQPTVFKKTHPTSFTHDGIRFAEIPFPLYVGHLSAAAAERPQIQRLFSHAERYTGKVRVRGVSEHPSNKPHKDLPCGALILAIAPENLEHITEVICSDQVKFAACAYSDMHARLAEIARATPAIHRGNA